VGVDRKIILKWKLGKEGSIPVTRSCEHGNDTTGSIKVRKSLHWLSDYQRIKKDSDPWSQGVKTRQASGSHMTRRWHTDAKRRDSVQDDNKAKTGLGPLFDPTLPTDAECRNA
jgi:hypothetical protein